MCTRPYGRRRTDGSAEPTHVCDSCWAACGGTAHILARLGAGQTPLLLAAPEVEAQLAAADTAGDPLHPLDRLLIDAGVRWEVLRTVPPPARVELAMRVCTRQPPKDSRRADSPQSWMDAVLDRIHLSPEFKQQAKRNRWAAICHIWSIRADYDGRPLTWIPQDQIAEAMGCSTKTVQRCAGWLQRERLLHEVVPGTRLPQMHVPEGAGPGEREAARARWAQDREAAQQGRADDTANQTATHRAKARAELRTLDGAAHNDPDAPAHGTEVRGPEPGG